MMLSSSVVVQVWELPELSQHRVRAMWADLLRLCNHQLAAASSKDEEIQPCVAEMMHAMSAFLTGHGQVPAVHLLSDTAEERLAQSLHY